MASLKLRDVKAFEVIQSNIIQDHLIDQHLQLNRVSEHAFKRVIRNYASKSAMMEELLERQIKERAESNGL